MSASDDIDTALTSADWSGATVERVAPPAKVTHSVRLDADVSAAVVAEADRRGVRASDILRELVDAGLAAQGRASDEPVLVHPAQLKSALESALAAALRGAKVA